MGPDDTFPNDAENSISPTLARLFAEYKFPSLPSPPALLESHSSVSPNPPPSCADGLIMVSRYINQMIKLPPRHFSTLAPGQPTSGWTDGTTSWRLDIYGIPLPNHQASSKGASNIHNGAFAHRKSTKHNVVAVRHIDLGPFNTQITFRRCPNLYSSGRTQKSLSRCLKKCSCSEPLQRQDKHIQKPEKSKLLSS